MKYFIKNNYYAFIFIFWSVINFSIFFLDYIGLGEVGIWSNLGINGYKLMFTFDKEFFITILAIIQIILSIIIFGMLISGVLFILLKDKRNKYSIRYSVVIFRVLPILMIGLSSLLITTMFIGVKASNANRDGLYIFSWQTGIGVNLFFTVNLVISIILLVLSMRLLKSKVQS